MTALRIDREEVDGKVMLRLEGSFDGQTALMLRRSLQALSALEVVIDFGRVAQFEDLAVGILTHGLGAKKLQLRGLGRHQQRMFEYFGVSPKRATERAYYTPEDVLAH